MKNKIYRLLSILILLVVLACKEKDHDDPKVQTPTTPKVDSVEHVTNAGDWDQGVEVYIDNQYNTYFTRSSGWNGGDGAFSTLLSDGRIVWSFGDSFFGTVESNRARFANKNIFVRNAVLVQQAVDSDVFTSLNTGSTPTSLITYHGHNEKQDWYWPSDASVQADSLYLILSHMTSTGSGAWEFARASTDVAVFSLPDLVLKRIVYDKYKGAVTYGGAIYEGDDGFIYIYGNLHGYLTTNVYVARIPNGSLVSDWQYWDGTSWGNEFVDHPVYVDASDMFSVFKDGDKYYLFTQEVNLERRFFISEATSPTGPWSNPKTLYKVPAEQGTGTMYSYNAIVHEELSRKGELVISYSVNPTDFATNFNSPGSADKYRPFFIRVTGWK